MTTRITGDNYTGAVREVLDGGSREVLLGVNAFGANTKVVFRDTPGGVSWSMGGAKGVSVCLRDGNRNITVIGQGDVFPGGEGRTLIFKNPLHPKNRIEVEFSSKERSR